MNSKTPDVFQDLTEFCTVSATFKRCKPGQVPEEELRKLCHALINEEVNTETLASLDKLKQTYSPEIMAELLDGIVDSVYVLVWAAYMLNLPFNEAWNEVQKKNMEKFPKCTCATGCDKQGITVLNEIRASYKCIEGRLVYKNVETGKVVKPEGWTPPDINSILHEYWADLICKADPIIQPTVISSSHRKQNEG